MNVDIEGSSAPGAGPVSTAAPLRSALGAHWKLVSAVFLLVVALFGAVHVGGRPPARFEARATVLARELSMPVFALPRLAIDVFRSGSVAERAAADPLIPYGPESLIPGHGRVEPIPDTSVLVVVGRDRNPDRAVRIANALAESLAAELHGVRLPGRFFVLDHARRTELVKPASGSSVKTTAVAGLVTAVTGASALVLGIAVLRSRRRPQQPVTEAGQSQPWTRRRFL